MFILRDDSGMSVASGIIHRDFCMLLSPMIEAAGRFVQILEFLWIRVVEMSRGHGNEEMID
jgi:hypothetical protein